MINYFRWFYLKKENKPVIWLLAEETRTMILYVSPHKLLKTLAEFITYFRGQTYLRL
jgi:16S rRNA (cytidine1402-2'-O)-methyltransferase